MTIRRLFQIAGWLCVALIGALSIVAPSLRPVTILPHDLEHAAIFALTGLALGLGYPNRARLHMPAMIVFAAVIEIVQLYAPGRHARMIDFVVDALSACAGVALATALTWLRARAAESPSQI
jgi:VanZ family protein